MTFLGGIEVFEKFRWFRYFREFRLFDLTNIKEHFLRSKEKDTFFGKIFCQKQIFRNQKF